MTVHCEWGLHGIETLRDAVGVIVIVDVLSFSTAVDVATARGALVCPRDLGQADGGPTDAAPGTREAEPPAGSVIAQPRGAPGGGFSLSPVSLSDIAPATRLILPSPNGGRLSLACGDRPVFTGCLRNATALAESVRAFAAGRDIAVIPAGERWPDGSLRPAIEDWLGAGAIIAGLGPDLSAEAETACMAWHAARADVARLVRTSASGRELIAAGHGGDVEMAVDVDASDGAPLLVDGAYRQ